MISKTIALISSVLFLLVTIHQSTANVVDPASCAGDVCQSASAAKPYDTDDECAFLPHMDYNSRLQSINSLYSIDKEKAIGCIRKLGFYDESRTEAWSMLVNYYRSLNPPFPLKVAEALEKLLQYHPDSSHFLTIYGQTLHEAGDTNKARKQFEKAVAVDPNNTMANIYLGYISRNEHDLIRAKDLFETALTALDTREPLFPTLHYDYCSILCTLGQSGNFFAEAERCVSEGLQRSDDKKNLYQHRMGQLKSSKRQFTEALSFFEAATADPLKTTGEMWFDLGKAYITSGATPIKAVLAYREAAIRMPTNAMAIYALAVTLRAAHNSEAAHEMFAEAHRLAPTDMRMLGDYSHSLKQVCDWEKLESLRPLIQQKLEAGEFPEFHPYTAMLFNMSQRVILNLATAVSSSAQHTPLFKAHEHTVEQTSKRPIRIGYVSCNLINHAQGTQMSSYFKQHDRTKFKVFAYSLRRPFNAEGESAQEHLRKQVDVFVDLASRDSLQRALRISEDKIDILIDLSGLIDEADIQLFAYRPAPVQISFLGYPGTTGAGYIDYYIGDAVSTPIHSMGLHFTEQLVLMPHSYQITEHRETYGTQWESTAHVFAVPEITENDFYRASLERNDTAFVFCNFNQLTKLDGDTFAVWMNILRRVPNSILWMLASPSSGVARIREHAKKAGIEASRIVFSNSTEKSIHMRRLYTYARLWIDTPIYNAHTSAGDSMFAGVPILTIEGELMASRVASSMIRALRPDLAQTLVVQDLQTYEERAVHLATHPEELAQLRRRILEARMTAPLFDTALYVRDFERMLHHVLSVYQRGLHPMPFAVADLPELKE